MKRKKYKSIKGLTKITKKERKRKGKETITRILKKKEKKKVGFYFGGSLPRVAEVKREEEGTRGGFGIGLFGTTNGLTVAEGVRVRGTPPPSLPTLPLKLPLPLPLDPPIVVVIVDIDGDDDDDEDDDEEDDVLNEGERIGDGDDDDGNVSEGEET
jgi:hypothetical protein